LIYNKIRIFFNWIFNWTLDEIDVFSQQVTKKFTFLVWNVWILETQFSLMKFHQLKF